MERKKAVVTGASRGIGNGIARCLAREGYDLAISYATKQEEAQKLANELQETYGGKCFCFQASLEKEGVGVELLKKSVEALGDINAAVNSLQAVRHHINKTAGQLMIRLSRIGQGGSCHRYLLQA